jgi:hypothetical protein
MPTSTFSPTGSTLNFRVNYSYSDYKGNSHKNFIDIDGCKSEPSPKKVSACVAARWRKKKYTEGIYESITIESIE